MSKTETLNRQVVIQIVTISSIVLGLLLFGGNFLVDYFFKESKWSGSILAGINLFGIWLVVTSAIRSINSTRKKIPGWTFLLSGILVTIGGILLHELLAYMFQQAGSTWSASLLGSRSYLFYAAVATIISVMILIKLRVKDHFWGNVLEFLVIAGVIALLILAIK